MQAEIYKETTGVVRHGQRKSKAMKLRVKLWAAGRHQSSQGWSPGICDMEKEGGMLYNHYSIQTLEMMSVFLGHVFYYSYFIEQGIGMERGATWSLSQKYPLKHPGFKSQVLYIKLDSKYPTDPLLQNWLKERIPYLQLFCTYSHSSNWLYGGEICRPATSDANTVYICWNHLDSS